MPISTVRIAESCVTEGHKGVTWSHSTAGRALAAALAGVGQVALTAEQTPESLGTAGGVSLQFGDAALAFSPLSGAPGAMLVWPRDAPRLAAAEKWPRTLDKELELMYFRLPWPL